MQCWADPNRPNARELAVQIKVSRTNGWPWSTTIRIKAVLGLVWRRDIAMADPLQSVVADMSMSLYDITRDPVGKEVGFPLYVGTVE